MKNRTVKRLTAVLLSSMMMVSTCDGSVYAEEFPEEYYEQEAELSIQSEAEEAAEPDSIPEAEISAETSDQEDETQITEEDTETDAEADDSEETEMAVDGETSDLDETEDIAPASEDMLPDQELFLPVDDFEGVLTEESDPLLAEAGDPYSYRYDYDLPFSGENADNQILKGWSRGFSANMWYDAFDKETDEWRFNGNTSITNVQIVQNDFWDDEANDWVPADHNLADVEYREEDRWYEIHAEEFGRAVLKITWLVPGTDDRISENREVFITDGDWNLNWQFENGTDYMLPGETKTVSFRLHRSFIEGEGYDGEECKVRVTVLDEEGNPSYDTSYLQIEEDGSELHITSLKEENDVNPRIRVRAFTENEQGEEEEVCYVFIYIHTLNFYWNLLPESPERQILLGETMDLSAVNWQLVRNETGKAPQNEILDGKEFRIRLDGYDENAWTEKKGNNPLLPSLVRKGNWGTDIRIVAERPERDEDGKVRKDKNGDVIWEEISSRSLWFDNLDYALWFGGEEMRGGNWTWVFDNEKMTIQPNLKLPEGQKLSASGLKIVWAIGNGGYDDEDRAFEKPLDSSVYTISKDTSTLTIDGAKWKQLNGTRDVDIRAALCYNDQEAADGWTGVDLRNAECRVDVRNGDDYRLPGWDDFIDRHTNGYIENASYPHGEDRDVTIRTVQVKILEGDPDAVTVEEEENGWNLRMNDYGHALITMTWDPMDPVMDPGTSSYHLYVESKKIWIDSWSLEETDHMIPGSSMRMMADVRAEYDGEGSGDTQSYTLKWAVTEGKDLISLQKDPDTDRLVTVRAKDQGEDFWDADACITITAFDPSGEEVCSSEEWIHIRNYFTKLTLTYADDDEELSVDPDRLPVGKAVRVRPLVKEYISSSGSENGKAVEGKDITENCRFTWDWNPGLLQIADSTGTNLEGRDPESYADQKIFTITRISTGDGNLDIRAEEWNEEGECWEERARYDRWIEGLDLRDRIYFSPEGMRGGENTWVFEDETLTLKLLSEGAVDDLSVFDIDWQIGKDYDDEAESFRQQMDASVVSLDKGKNTLTINGPVWKERRERLKENGQEDPFSWDFQIHIIFRYHGEWVHDMWVHVDFLYNESDFEDSRWGILLPTQTLTYLDEQVYYWVKNKDYPDGMGEYVHVDRIESSDEQVLKCVHDGTTWKVEPLVSGMDREADLIYTVSGGFLKAPATINHHIYVTDRYYEMHVYPDGSDNLLPGESRQLITEVFRCDYDADNKKVVYEPADPDTYRLEYEVAYNEHLFHVDQNGLVTTEKTQDYRDTRIRAKVTTKAENWTCEVECMLRLTDRYTYLTTEPYHADKGETIRLADIPATVMEYTERHPEGRALEEMTIRFEEPDYYQKAFLNLQEDGTLKATADTSLIKKGSPVLSGINMIAFGPTGQERCRGWADITICDHTYKLTKTVAATCLKAGEKIYTCTDCGKVKTESIPKLKATAKLTATAIFLKVKQSTTAVKVSGLAKGDSVVSWTSNKPAIAAVDKKTGKITGKKVGKATITVKLNSGLKKTVKVTVQKGEVACTKITGVKSALSLKKGKSVTLKPVIAPIACVQKITYTSSDTSVAAVDAKGKVTAKKKGSATITVKCGKKSFKCKVTVK